MARPVFTTDRTIRAVLVGCGGISRTWLGAAATLPGLEVVGLVDLDLGAAQCLRDEFALGCPTEVDLEAMLAGQRPDVLFDCTVPSAHHPNALTAFRHGVHVLAEKPLAETLEQARELVAGARAAGVLHAVTQNRRAVDGLRRIAEFVAGGRLGSLQAIYTNFFIGAHFGGFRGAMAQPLLFDMAVHHFDAARALSGLNAEQVYSEAWNPPGSWYGGAASASALFTLAGGVRFHSCGSWCAEGQPTSWEGEWRVIGTCGSVRWDGEGPPRAELVRAGGGFLSETQTFELPATPHPERTHGHASVMADFLACLRTGRTPETASSDNIHSLAMVLAAIESAERGERVPVGP